MVAAELATFLTELFNRSMSAGHFPATFKEAFITPAIKKPGLDAMDAQSYHPVSNLTVESKLLERIVARQLKCYLQSFDLLPSLQSGFQPGHSTETVVLRVMSDLLEAVDNGDVAALVLLDLSAAFDTVDHHVCEVYISPHCRQAPALPNVKLGIRGQLTDVITCVKFLVNQFRGYGVPTDQS